MSPYVDLFPPGTSNSASNNPVNLATSGVGGVTGTLPSANISPINLATSGNGGVTGTLPRANITSVLLASTSNGGTSGILPFARGGTGSSTNFTPNNVIYATTGAFAQDATGQFTWDNVNKRLAVGAQGTGKVNATVTSGSDLCFNASAQGTNNCIQAQNQNAYTLSLINASTSSVAGASIGGAFNRGTLASRTQSLNGDQIFSITGQGYTGAIFGPGLTNAISFVLSENTATTGNGGEIVFSTTPNATLLPVERMRLKNTGTLILNSLAPSKPVLSSATTALQSGAIILGSSAHVTGILPKTQVQFQGARYCSSSSTISSSLGTVSFNNQIFDTNSGYFNGVFTIPSSGTGKWLVGAAIAVTGTISLNNSCDLQIQQAGSFGQVAEVKEFAGGAITNFNVYASDVFNCVAGDTITIQATTNAALPSIVASSSQNYAYFSMIG